jgi:hypothetical protein
MDAILGLLPMVYLGSNLAHQRHALVSGRRWQRWFQWVLAFNDVQVGGVYWRLDRQHNCSKPAEITHVHPHRRLVREATPYREEVD